MSPQAIQNDLALSARRMGVTLDEAGYAAATERVTVGGLSPAQAVHEVGQQATPTVAAKPPARMRPTVDEAKEYARLLAAGKTTEEATQLILDVRKLRAMVPGTKTPRQMRGRIAKREATNEWPEP
jgi:hypothetical protein